MPKPLRFIFGRYGSSLLLSITSLVWLLLARSHDLLATPTLDEIFFFPALHGYGVFFMTLVIFCMLTVLYFAIFSLFVKTGRPRVISLFAFFVLVAVIGIFTSPIGARDMINYLLELKLIYYYGQNPYIVTPQAYSHDSFFAVSNVTSIPLYYGPAWIAISFIEALIMDFSNVFMAIVVHKMMNTITLFLCCVVLYRATRSPKERITSILLFGLNPLVIFETIVNGHNDILIFLLLLLAYVMKNRSATLSSFLLGTSVLVKYYPIFLIPFFALYYLKSKKRRNILYFIAGLGLNIIFIVPFWADGKFVMGAINGVYLSQLAFYNTSLLSLSRELGNGFNFLPGVPLLPVFVIASFVILSCILYIGYWKNKISLVWGIILQLVLILILVSLLYPWYLIPVFGFLALLGTKVARRFIFFLTGAGFFYYFTFGILSFIGIPNLTVAHIIQFSVIIGALIVPVWMSRFRLNFSGPEET